MKLYKDNIDTTEEAADFVLECERDFFSKLDSALESIFENGTVRVIMLSGPTCSGKTTTADRLTEKIVQSGHNAVVLSIDDFFLDRNDRNVIEGEAPDYDSVKAIDLDYLREFSRDLLDGKKVMIPRYSFPETARIGYDEYIPDERDIYVFEGIQAVYPEITSMFGGEEKSIFIRASEDIEYKNMKLEANELRLLRRIVRDNEFRGATAEFTLHLWDGVRDNEEKNIFPNAKDCDVYINSTLGYEPFIIAHHAISKLETVPRDSRYRAEADRLIEKLSYFDNPCFEDAMIPEHSVFREFIGK